MPRRALRDSEINDQVIIDLLDGVPDILTAANMRPYQRFMSERMQAGDCLVCAEPGLGKTGATLHALRRMLDDFEVKRVLIIGPVNVARFTWPEELRRWEFARALSYSLLVGPEDERRAAAAQATDIHIINRENLVWLRKFWGAAWPYDCLVYDEASRLKGAKKRTGKTTRRDGTVTGNLISEFGMLCRMRYTFKRRILLTGTPAPNGLLDLWGPMYVLDGGERLGTSMTAYKQRWFNEDRYSYAIEPKAHAEREITDRIRDCAFSLREKDYLTLPPLVEIDRWVRFPPEVLAKYRRLEKTMVLAEHDIEAVSAGVLTNKLLQLSNGSVYDTERTAVPFHDLKLDELESIRAEQAGTSLLIAYSFQFDLERIKKRFPKFRIFGESKNDLRDWNAGRIPGLIVHPASAGHGLNFQHGSNVAVWYGLNWSLELYQQFNKRLHRSGQKSDKVFMYRILGKGTYDERQIKVLGENGATQDRIMDDIRGMQREYRLAA